MGISIAYDACRRRFLCRHREGRGLTFARTIKGPFGSCRVTSQIIAFPTSYRIRSTPPRHKSHTQPEMQQFCANRLAAFRFLYERYFSAITGNLVIRRFIDKTDPSIRHFKVSHLPNETKERLTFFLFLLLDESYYLWVHGTHSLEQRLEGKQTNKII